VHIPDGFLDTKTWAICMGVAGIGLAVVVRRANREVKERIVPLAAMLGAFIFVAQMINFPIGGGTSGHLVGGTLMALLLGPWLAALVMTVVLLVQSLIFQDGGLLAFGANCFNMAFVGVFSGYLSYRVLSRVLPQAFRVALGAFIAAWFSVVLSAAVCSMELAFSGIVPLMPSLVAMTSVHAAIGVGEGLITAAILVALHRQKHALAPEAEKSPITRWEYLFGFGLLCVIALFLAPFASSLPDGLEKIASQLHFLSHERSIGPVVISGYELPGLQSSFLAVLLAGLIGLFLVLALTYGLLRLTQRKSSVHKGRSSDAS
jgi:cobalt/nickel transport system permease protein